MYFLIYMWINKNQLLDYNLYLHLYFAIVIVKIKNDKFEENKINKIFLLKFCSIFFQFLIEFYNINFCVSI